ncbi:signal peptide peptidase SppA [Candidatus Babeliales bacterium]|nr:signal peptide peptidase SppA [Candidatus Babeliales bacterium]
MPENNNEKKKTSIFNIKNLFFLFIIFSLAQPLYINLKKQLKEAIHPNTYVGCINVTGMILDPSFYVKNIQKFLKKDEVKGLILKINSNGGLPGASQAIFSELKRFKKTKPIVAVVHDMAASGSYYVAAAADKIVANPSTIIGSIGVLMQLPNVKAFLNRYDLDMRLLHAGKYKTSGSIFKDMTAEETIHLEELMYDSYDQFVKDMAEARKLDISKKDDWANGKIFTGNQALKLGLIDQLGSLTDAKETTRKLLESRNIKVVGKIKLIYPKRLTGLAKVLYGEDENQHAENNFAQKAASFINSVYKYMLTEQTAEQIKLQ